MNPEHLPFVTGSAGTAKIGFVSVPAFCWVNRSFQIRDFLLLYRDIASTERNTWALSHLDSLLERVGQLEQRAQSAWNTEQSSLSSNYTGHITFPDRGVAP